MLKERPFPFPTDKSIRVIIDTDCYNECDDQYCVAHALMTPKFDIRGIIAEQFGGVYRRTGTELESYNEIKNIVHLMGLDGAVDIFHGIDTPLPDRNSGISCEGSERIIEEALTNDPRPLFVCTLGAMTNLAAAILKAPEIIGKMTVIGIVGAPYPKGGFEFNLMNDPVAADIVFTSGVKFWQVPSSVYTTMKVSYYELLNKVYPYGKLGKYLVKRTMEFNTIIQEKIAEMKDLLPADESGATPEITLGGELWSLGDSPTVGIMMNPTVGHYHTENAPCAVKPDGSYDFSEPGNGTIRVYDDIDNRFIVTDMFEKLKYNFGK